MPNELLPDQVEVFRGRTLELAMEAAVDALGSDLTVTGARKVRKGIPGLKANEHFEVLATRQAGAEQEPTDSTGVEALLGDAESVVDNAFAALLAQAEDEELATSPAVRHTQPRTTPHPAPDVVVAPEVHVVRAAARPAPTDVPVDGSSQAPAGDSGKPAHEVPADAPVAEAVPTEAAEARATGEVSAETAAQVAAEAPEASPTSEEPAAPEVVAAPDPASPEAADGVLADAKTAAQEDKATRRPTAPRPRTSDEQAPAARGRSPKPAAKRAAKAATKVTAKAPAKPVKAARPKATAAAPKPVRKAGTPVSTRRTAAADVPPGWSRAALVALGLPDAVLAALPSKDPASDLAWVAALERALSRTVPGPKTLGDDAPCVLAAHGVEGVVQMIAASIQTGLPVGVVTVDGGRVAPATATELALVLRAAVVGGR